MFLLLGLNHLLQYKNSNISTTLFDEFSRSLIEIQSQYNIQYIVEEYNEDCLLLNNIKQSFLQEFSKQHHLNHRFIDPTLQERIKLGIASPHYDLEYLKSYKVREDWWYEHILDLSEHNVLVCIGAHHIESFEKLLNEHLQKTLTLYKYWHEASFTSHK